MGWDFWFLSLLVKKRNRPRDAKMTRPFGSFEFLSTVTQSSNMENERAGDVRSREASDFQHTIADVTNGTPGPASSTSL